MSVASPRWVGSSLTGDAMPQSPPLHSLVTVDMRMLYFDVLCKQERMHLFPSVNSFLNDSTVVSMNCEEFPACWGG